MALQLIVKNRWKIYFYEEDGICPIDTYIKDNFNEKAQCHIRACFSHLADKGRSGLSTDLFHSAADGEEIKSSRKTYKMFGLHKGEHRLYSILIEEDKTIIFTHGTTKRQQKTSKQDILKFQQLVTMLLDESEVQ